MDDILANKLEVWGFEGNTVIFTDGSLGFALESFPMDASCFDGGRINELSEKVKQFLNGLPEGIDLQFVQEIKSGNDRVISGHQAMASSCQNPLSLELLQKRLDRYKIWDQNGDLPQYHLKVFVRKKMDQDLVPSRRLFAITKHFPEISEKNLEKEIGKINRLKEDLMLSLETVGLRTRHLTSDSIVGDIYELWNPTRGVALDAYDPTDIRNHLLYSDAHIFENGFSLLDMHHRVISLKILPGQTFMSMSQVFQELPFDSKLFLSIEVPNQQREFDSLQMQRRLAFSMVYGKENGVSDLESGAKLEDLQGLLIQMIAQGEKVFHVGLNVLLRSRNLEDLEDQVSQTLLKIRELNGAEAMTEGLAAFDIFSSFAFPNSRVKERKKRLKTSNLKDMLPIFGPWVGHGEPRVLLRSRMGTLVKFDPFSSELTNANQLVSGGSGSGKSFLTNLLLIQMLKESPKVFIIDIGGSYQKICENLSGQYIPLGLDKGIHVNPFDLTKGNQPSFEKLKFLLALIESMTKEEENRGLRKIEKSEIEILIQSVYERHKNPRLSHLRELLCRHELPEISRIGKILSSWCGKTPYGNFLDADSNISFDRSIVCFDLKGLENYPDFQSACLLMITDLIWREVERDRTQMKFIVFDECWKLLEDEMGEGAKFIGSVFRTCRKYFTSCVAISQNLDDFAASQVANAIMTNSSTKWVLKQKGADKSRLKEVLDLNDNEVDLIFSLQQKRGEFSEALLVCEDNKSVVVVESTPQEYWLATTDPKDLRLMENVQSQNPNNSQLEIINQLAHSHPLGAGAARVDPIGTNTPTNNHGGIH